MLRDIERATLALALDALLPPSGSFPAPSDTDIVDAIFLRRVAAPAATAAQWPGLDLEMLRGILDRLHGASDTASMTTLLAELERDDPATFRMFWQLAVLGYYSREEVIAAIAADLAPEYHGAPLPRGYAHMLTPWDASDPLQLPRHPRGSYQPTEAVRRVDLARMQAALERAASA